MVAATLKMAGKPSAMLWEDLFANCSRSISKPSDFSNMLFQLLSTAPMYGRSIFRIWSKQHVGVVIEPGLLLCFDRLLASTAVTETDVLNELVDMIQRRLMDMASYEYTKVYCKIGQTRTETACMESIEAAVLNRMTAHSNRRRTMLSIPQDRVAVIRAFSSLVALMSCFNECVPVGTILNGFQLEIANAVGSFIAAHMNDLSLANLLTCNDGHPPPAFCRAFEKCLPRFIDLISIANPETAQSLHSLQQQSGLHSRHHEEVFDAGIVDDINAIAFQASVLDSTAVPARASLYVYLNAMLCSRPVADDANLFAFLNARYSGNVPILVADLITASFDVLANAINRTESNESIAIYRSFLTNKLPLLLESYASMIFPPLTIEICITDALNRMDPTADPFSTQTFDLLSSSGMLSEARQEFLFACALYQLIQEQSIESILGDVPMQSLPEAGKYEGLSLVEQCTANPSRIEELIRELENMEGNAAEIASALVQVIQALCLGKETTRLKSVCNALAGRVQALDVILLFTQPRAILQPICGLLDSWHEIEEQSEYHSVYDEFGSILLLILIFRDHFCLHSSEFGISSPDSFVLKYLSTGRMAHGIKELSEMESKLLAGWIKGLFETEAISDELMSSCSPKDFYLLVATLFDQSLQACQAGVLPMDTLQGGFEYLLEPFLLPSLAAGLGWFTFRLWATHEHDAHLDFLLPVLRSLINPTSLSSAASSLHTILLTLAAPALERALAHVQQLHPRRQDLDPLLGHLKAHLRTARSPHASHPELEAWSAHPSGGLVAAVRHTAASLLRWSVKPAQNPNPPSYTHRQLVAAIALSGAKSVLSALLDETYRAHTMGTEAADAMLDVVAALVCAPIPMSTGSAAGALSLRQVLQMASAEAYALSKRDAVRAEMLVRLQRRVEAQSLREGLAVPVPDEVLRSMGAEEVLKGLDAEGVLNGSMEAEALMDGMAEDIFV